MEQTLQAITCRNNLAIWTERVQACRTSGLSVKTWCAENGIIPNTYFRWQKKVFNAMQTDQERFYEVPMYKANGRASVCIELNGVTAQVFRGADEETVLTVLRAMRSC
jgi:hypothetical protein